MDSLESGFPVFFVPIFSYKVRIQKLYPRKAYAVDAGLPGQSLSGSLRMWEGSREQKGTESGDEIFCWGNREVDFLLKKA